MQPLTVLLVQHRLATGTAGFYQTGLAFAPILTYPARNCLRNYTDPASNSCLGLAPLPQPNGLHAAFLKRNEIAAYPTRISHAYLDAVNNRTVIYIMRDSIEDIIRQPSGCYLVSTKSSNQIVTAVFGGDVIEPLECRSISLITGSADQR